MSNQIQTAFAMKYKKKAINKDYNGKKKSRKQSRGAFLVGEASSHNAEGYPVYSCFKREGDSFFAKSMTFNQFNQEVSA